MSNNREEYNKGGMIAFVFSSVFCLLFFVYISFIEKGVDLKEIPEQAAGGEAPAAFDITKIEKPWVENVEVVAYGQKVYMNNCASCHGKEGKGDGAPLNPPPRNFVEGNWKQGGSSADLYKTIAQGFVGNPTMASFKHLPKADRWALVQYIRSITQNKVADDAAKLDAYGPTAE